MLVLLADLRNHTCRLVKRTFLNLLEIDQNFTGIVHVPVKFWSIWSNN